MAAPAGVDERDFNRLLASGKDMIPPRRITDLEVMKPSNGSDSVELHWTATWDERDQGQYFDIFVESGNGTLNYSTEWIRPGNSSVVADRMSWLLSLPAFWKEGGVAAYVVAVDSGGNMSPPSNRVTWELAPTAPTEPTEPTGQNEVLIIIVVVAGSVAVAAATAWTVYTQKKRARVTDVGLVNEDAGL